MSAGLAHSVQVRLVRHAKAINADPNLIFARYATERLLYRFSRPRSMRSPEVSQDSRHLDP